MTLLWRMCSRQTGSASATPILSAARCAAVRSSASAFGSVKREGSSGSLNLRYTNESVIFLVGRAMLTNELTVFSVLRRDQVRAAYSLCRLRELAEVLVRDDQWIVAGPGVAML